MQQGAGEILLFFIALNVHLKMYKIDKEDRVKFVESAN